MSGQFSKACCWAMFGLAVTFCAVGCDVCDLASLSTSTATVSEVFATDASPKVVVETFNGTIDISEGQADEVVVEVVKRAGGIDTEAAKANLNNVQVEMIQTADGVHVIARRLDRRLGNCGASVVIAVPKGARLNLKSSNGYILCEGMEGSVEAKTSNARLEIVAGRGSLDLSTSNGPIVMDAADATVEAHTSNARVEFRGTLAAGEHEFKSSNGGIDIRLPPESQFRLKASTSNGHVRCDFPIDAAGDKRRRGNRRLEGMVGKDPRTEIKLATSNASVNVRPLEARGD